MTYANGLAPDSALAFVDGMHVAPMLAPRLNAFIAYSATQGRVLRVVRKYGGYRQRAPLAPEQEAVYAAGATGGSSVSVAKPGSSTHGDYNTGRVDLGNLSTGYTSAGLAWIVANAGRFGLVREFGTADPNHFVASGSFAGGTVTPIDDMTTDPQHRLTQEEIDDMTASQSAAFIRNYQRDGQQGNAGGDFICRALQYPDGTRVRLHNTQDVDALSIGHIGIYGLPRTDGKAGGQPGDDQHPTYAQQYGAQLSDAQWRWSNLIYGGPMHGFIDDDFPADATGKTLRPGAGTPSAKGL